MSPSWERVAALQAVGDELAARAEALIRWVEPETPEETAALEKAIAVWREAVAP